MWFRSVLLGTAWPVELGRAYSGSRISLRFRRLELERARKGLARGRGRERIGDFRGVGAPGGRAGRRDRDLGPLLELVGPGEAGMAEFCRFSRLDPAMLEGRCWKAGTKRAEKLGLAACVVSLAGCRAASTRPAARPRSSAPRRDPLCPHSAARTLYHGRATEHRNLDRRSGPTSGHQSSPPIERRARPGAPKGQLR